MIARAMSGDMIISNLQSLAEWLQATHPGKGFEITIAGGAALALLGVPRTTTDVDVLRPATLPPELVEGARVVARAKGLGPEWLSDAVARVLTPGRKAQRLPAYFQRAEKQLQVAPNMSVILVSRQALISMKLFAASPSARKHTDDLLALKPTARELKAATSFVLSRDNSGPRREDLALVLKTLGARQ